MLLRTSIRVFAPQPRPNIHDAPDLATASSWGGLERSYPGFPHHFHLGQSSCPMPWMSPLLEHREDRATSCRGPEGPHPCQRKGLRQSLPSMFWSLCQGDPWDPSFHNRTLWSKVLPGRLWKILAGRSLGSLEGPSHPLLCAVPPTTRVQIDCVDSGLHMLLSPALSSRLWPRTSKALTAEDPSFSHWT